MKLLKGNLSISRPVYSDGHEDIRITLQDDLSDTRCFELTVGLVEFLKALTGQGFVDCVFELHPEKVGMVSEHKTGLVPLVTPHGARIAEMRKFEVDGWTGRESDLFNGHCFVRNEDGEFQCVNFFRHVPAKEQP